MSGESGKRTGICCHDFANALREGIVKPGTGIAPGYAACNNGWVMPRPGEDVLPALIARCPWCGQVPTS